MQIGDGLPVAVAFVAILMGLNLLEVVPLRLPSLDVDVRSLSLPPTLQAYLAGASWFGDWHRAGISSVLSSCAARLPGRWAVGTGGAGVEVD